MHGATRAPYVALDLIAGAKDWPIEEGYAAEESAMAELLVSPQAQASAYAFTVVERRSKKPPNLPDAKPRRVQKVGIVGAGLMATQLATLFLRRLEVPVVLRDLDQARVDEALATIREEVGARKPFLATIVDGGTGWDQFAGCDLVLEAVFEELDVKRDVFAEVRKVAPDAILATNTSSLSVEEMGADVGLHFFNPVAVLPLVEIVRTPQTTDEQLATAWDVVKKLRKRGVLVGDAPAFVVNRVLTRMTTVLMDSLEHGNTVEETDEAVLSLGLPMAPSVLLQMVGPRVANHVLETLHDAYPDRYPLSPTLANFAAGQRRDRAHGRCAPERRADPGGRARGDRRRGSPPARRRRRPGGRRRRCLPDPRRRLPLLPRRDHEASRRDGHLRAGHRVETRRVRQDSRLMADDWRIRITVTEQADGLLDRLGGHPRRGGGRARGRARETPARSVAGRRRALRLCGLAEAKPERARNIIVAVLQAEKIEATTGAIEHWLDGEDRWDDEPPGETWEEEELERGYAPWEVRVTLPSHREARALAETLEGEGYSVDRRWRYLIVGTASKADAEALAQRVHGEVEPGGELVWETVPGNPFAVFGGLGSAGTPV